MNGFILGASETLVMVLKKGENLVHTNIHSYSVQMTICLVTQLCPTLCNHMDCNPVKLLCPWGFFKQEFWSGFPALLQGIFPIQGSNPGLPHCRWILYSLSHQGSLQMTIYIYKYATHKVKICLQCWRPWFDSCVRKIHSRRERLLLLSRFSRVWLCATPETAAYQAPLSLGFSRQEHWSGLSFPSPMHESEKWKWSRSVVSDS